jgi:PPP family 3-phenylpropionic acid transporter
MATTPLYWRLSGFYLFYFGTLGALVPYWTLYLKSLGFGPAQIGELMAIVLGTKVIAPNVWGWIADRRGVRMPIVRFASLLAAVTFAGVFLASGYWWLAAVMSVFSFFWNAALPQFEANTLSHLGADAERYTRIRVWGSIGFIAVVTGLGPALDAWGVGLLPWALLALMSGIWLATVTVPEQPVAAHEASHGGLGAVLRQPAVAALLAACFLIQLSHGPYYAFYSIYLEGHGYSRTLIGQLWALGVLAEVVLFVVMHALIRRYGLRNLFLATFALTTLRWVLVGLFPGMLPVLLGAQLLHAASFGVYHAVAIQLIHRFFRGRHQGRGQALYSSLSFGAGGAVGSLLAGYAWDTAGPLYTYLGAACVSALGLFTVWRWIDGHEVRRSTATAGGAP